MSENQVVNACIRWLWLHGVYCWRNNSGGYKSDKGNFIRYGHKGSSDIIGITPSGRFISVEAKHGKNKLQPSQEEFRDKILACNGIYIVAYSTDDLEARKNEIV